MTPEQELKLINAIDPPDTWKTLTGCFLGWDHTEHGNLIIAERNTDTTVWLLWFDTTNDHDYRLYGTMIRRTDGRFPTFPPTTIYTEIPMSYIN